MIHYLAVRSWTTICASILCVALVSTIPPTRVSASSYPTYPQGGTFYFDFLYYDPIWDATYGFVQGFDYVQSNPVPYHFNFRHKDGLPFSVGPYYIDGLWYSTETGGYLSYGEVPDFYYVQGLRNGKVIEHYTLPENEYGTLPFNGVYDEIRFGWHFPNGVSPALSAEEGWGSPGSQLSDFLAPGEIGCYYFTCGKWSLYADITAVDPSNSLRPTNVPLPAPAAGLLASLASLALIRRKRRCQKPA
ncbi:hypothetical protein AB0T83_01880 [Fluviibacterium sp. DFM31]|uniref:PEP-CTERM sorting domain-containing protein n=1 Tax=Meridianimarinicoccus marinus TaxID=3231483 RepID=A0ABV3L1U1_9RHOB